MNAFPTPTSNISIPAGIFFDLSASIGSTYLRSVNTLSQTFLPFGFLYVTAIGICSFGIYVIIRA